MDRKKALAIKPKICYITNTNKKATAHKRLTIDQIAMPEGICRKSAIP